MGDQKCLCVICDRCIDNRESSAVLFPKDEPRMSRWIKALKIRNVEEFVWKLQKRDIAFACHYHVASLRRNHVKVNNPYDRPRLNPKYASLCQTNETIAVAVSTTKPSVSTAGLLIVIRSVSGYCCYCKTNSDGIFVRMPYEANLRAMWYARMGFFDSSIERSIILGDYEKTLLCVEHFARFFRGTAMYFTENFPYSYLSNTTVSRRAHLYRQLILESSLTIARLDTLPSFSICASLKEHLYGANFLNVPKIPTETLFGKSKCITADAQTASRTVDESIPNECSTNCDMVLRRYHDQGFGIIKNELLDTEADSVSTTMGSEREDHQLVSFVVGIKQEPPGSPTDQEHTSFPNPEVNHVESND